MHANSAVVLNGGRERPKMVQDVLESPMPAPDSLKKSVLANKKQDKAFERGCVQRAAQGFSRCHFFFLTLPSKVRLNYLPIAIPAGLPA